MNISKKEAEKKIRAKASSVNLTFKKSNTRLNGAYLWKLVCRRTGDTVIPNYQFWSAYNDACDGYISSWDGSYFRDTLINDYIAITEYREKQKRK